MMSAVSLLNRLGCRHGSHLSLRMPEVWAALAIGSFNKERMEHEQSAESCDRCGGVADVSRHPILLIAGLLPVLAPPLFSRSADRFVDYGSTSKCKLHRKLRCTIIWI